MNFLLLSRTQKKTESQNFKGTVMFQALQFGPTLRCFSFGLMQDLHSIDISTDPLQLGHVDPIESPFS